ncbi:MAG: TlpA family protein disulfide reductase [Acidobacteriaceae bacterium]|nr:TlpA family protein disulfide reductase [Acidobacteriaceae bacterium]
MYSINLGLRTAVALAIIGPCVFAQDSTDIPPTYGQPPTPKVVAYVISALQHGDLEAASAMVGQYRRLYGDTPEALDALSWLARGELGAGHPQQALNDAEEIERLSRAALGTRKLDAEPYLPIALGAAYEVHAEALFEQHKEAEALQLLRTALQTWRGTSLVDRLEKTINLLTLEGKPVPALHVDQWIGTKPQPQASWRGKVVLLFFWAHWCADCKAEEPIIAKLANEFASRGLLVVAPTRLYGYTAQEENAPPATELPFVKKVFEKYYAGIPQLQVPVNTANFQRFGASTTPTIVLVDRQGIVRLYHPGAMAEASLRSAIEKLLAGDTAKAARSRVGDNF